MKFLLVLFILLFTISCSTKNKDAAISNETTQKPSKTLAIEKEIAEIEQITAEKGQLASSMRYTKDNGAAIVVNAHLDENGNIIKVEEDFNEGEGHNFGLNTFYFKNSKLIGTKERFSDVESKTPAFIERISYYDKNEKPIRTIEKRVTYEEELDQAQYKEVALHKASNERAKRVLAQSDEFETTFQGFVEVQALNYLILGAKNSTGYVTSLRLDYEDAFIKQLLVNPKKYLNRKMYVTFQNVTDPTGFQYQSYLTGKFID